MWSDITKAFSAVYSYDRTILLCAPTVKEEALLKSGFVFKEQEKNVMYHRVKFFQQSEIQ